MAQAVARGISAQEHVVDLIDGETDAGRSLTAYEYIVIGACPVSFFRGNISQRIQSYLKNSGMLSGKRSYAFMRKRGLASARALRKLMIEMEKEGMMLKRSDVLFSIADAEAVGRKLRIKK